MLDTSKTEEEFIQPCWWLPVVSGVRHIRHRAHHGDQAALIPVNLLTIDEQLSLAMRLSVQLRLSLSVASHGMRCLKQLGGDVVVRGSGAGPISGSWSRMKGPGVWQYRTPRPPPHALTTSHCITSGMLSLKPAQCPLIFLFADPTIAVGSRFGSNHRRARSVPGLTFLPADFNSYETDRKGVIRCIARMPQGADGWKLAPHPNLPKGKKIMLIVLDGWGEQIGDEFNAIHRAETPIMDHLKTTAPEKWRLLKAHGSAVGLPTEDDMGNSEVGHNALGAGRIFKQGASLVDSALETGAIFDGAGFKYVKEALPNGTLHLIGLLSDGGVHSRFDQLQRLLRGSAKQGFKKIRVHFLTDGRDVADGSSFQFAQMLEDTLRELRDGGCDALVASGGGRMKVTMDRYENDWNVVKNGWNAQVLGEAPHHFTSCLDALKKLREEDANVNDQYYPPFVIVDESGKPVGPIVDGDAVITFNFRADRMVMLAKALEDENFDKFDRVRFPKIKYAGMLQYDAELKLPGHYLVSPPEISETSGEYLVHNGVKSWVCSETVKFGHVTFVWNGNRSGQFSSTLEKYVEIPSDQGISFDKKPEMKAIAIASKAAEALRSGEWDQVRVNIANGDMVGHTGNLDATVIGCTTTDKAIKIMLDATEEVGGIFIITADHGNAEDMVKRNAKTGAPIKDKNGNYQILTSHTCAPVPIAIGGPGLPKGVQFRTNLPNAGLANVASTFINLHGFEAPHDYEPTLIEVVE